MSETQEHLPVTFVHPENGEHHAKLAGRIANTPYIWDDRMRIDPVTTYLINFGGFRNVLFEIGNLDGFLGVTAIQPGWRGRTLMAAWTPAAMRRFDVFRTAAAAAMNSHDLLVLDAFISVRNVLSQRFAKNCGMTRRGKLKASLAYNGVVHDVWWYEITREDLGLPPIE